MLEKRPIRLEGDVAFVPLTKGYEAIIDAADAEYVGRFNWFARVKSEKTIYVVRAEPVANGRQFQVWLHRDLIKPPEKMFVDHINGNTLDNRRCNLRYATNAQNMRNRPAPITNSSGVKGVSWHARRGLWLARIKYDGVEYRLGGYADIRQAAEAYALAAEKYHGDFARIN